MCLTRAGGARPYPADPLHPFLGLPAAEPLTWRVRDDGFWLYFEGTDDRARLPELWHVDFTGQAELVGDYPPPPQGTGVGEARLAADGSVFQLGFGGGSNDVIVRRTLTGTADVVYDEATNPLVKIHISSLVTGP